MPIPVNTPYFVGNEIKYLTQCIETGWVSSEGEFVTRFEREMASQCGREFGIAVSSGTAALDVAITILNFNKGDEIILPAFTIISCVLQVIRAGLKPVFVDIDPISMTMRVDQIKKKISDRTKGIIAVHVYGHPADMDQILQIARDHNLKIIEDAAEMHGQTYKGRPCGSFGDISIFSFYPNKHITTGEGGMLVTNDRELDKKARYYRNLCFNEESRFVHDHLGWNYRMSNLQAAVGVAQLEYLDSTVERKRYIGQKYNELLRGRTNFRLPLEKTSYSENIYWVYPIVCLDSFVSQRVQNYLKEQEVGIRPFFYPINLQPVLKEYDCGSSVYDCPDSKSLYDRGFYIPSGLAITDEQIEFVADCLIVASEKFS